MSADGVPAMPLLAVNVEIIIELALLVFVLVLGIVIASIFICRDLKRSYKESWKLQSKFDIELRKAYEPRLQAGSRSGLRQVPRRGRQGSALRREEDAPRARRVPPYASIDVADPDNKYVVETFQNLQEIRVSLDAKALSYNKKISFFPFNLYSRIFRMTKLHHYAPHH
ncbi:MAG: hypothetical protein MZU97_07025 [Bacillus subtilis]|nr:hypothetical protein [Bacillus subtilis]